MVEAWTSDIFGQVTVSVTVTRKNCQSGQPFLIPFHCRLHFPWLPSPLRELPDLPLFSFSTVSDSIGRARLVQHCEYSRTKIKRALYK